MWGRFWSSLYQHMVPYPDVASVDPSEELRKQASLDAYFKYFPQLVEWIMDHKMYNVTKQLVPNLPLTQKKVAF